MIDNARRRPVGRRGAARPQRGGGAASIADSASSMQPASARWPRRSRWPASPRCVRMTNVLRRACKGSWCLSHSGDCTPSRLAEGTGSSRLFREAIAQPGEPQAYSLSVRWRTEERRSLNFQEVDSSRVVSDATWSACRGRAPGALWPPPWCGSLSLPRTDLPPDTSEGTPRPTGTHDNPWPRAS
jgi:hypothetical protein